MQARRFIRTYWTNNSTLRGAIAGILGFVGLLFLYVSFDLYFVDDDSTFAAELKTLARAETITPGQRVLVDGLVAAETPQLREEFVAYRLTEYRCPRPGTFRCSSEHVEVEAKKQPFVVVTSSGPVLIANADYRFDERAPEWAAKRRVESAPTWTKHAVTIWGFARSSPVVVLGTVETARPDVSVRADTIMAGPASAVIERLKAQSRRAARNAPYVLFLGLLMVVVAARESWRLIRGERAA